MDLCCVAIRLPFASYVIIRLLAMQNNDSRALNI
jgi:hypothetical protein